MSSCHRKNYTRLRYSAHSPYYIQSPKAIQEIIQALVSANIVRLLHFYDASFPTLNCNNTFCSTLNLELFDILVCDFMLVDYAHEGTRAATTIK